MCPAVLWPQEAPMLRHSTILVFALLAMTPSSSHAGRVAIRRDQAKVARVADVLAPGRMVMTVEFPNEVKVVRLIQLGPKEPIQYRVLSRTAHGALVRRS